MHIGEILNVIYDEDVGWRPASGGIKPVHVANGLVRSLQGKYYDTTGLNRFVVWWQAGGAPHEDRTLEALARDDARGALSAFTRSPQHFDRLRRYALGLLGADKALFPSADKSSFSLTCGRMVTRDNNDRGLGDFAAMLINGDDKLSLAREVLRSVTDDRPADPVTALVWPLLPEEGRDYKPATRLAKAGRQRHNKQVFAVIREAALTLATHERAQGNRLHTLHRAVHFACVATHVHAQALAGGGDLARRPPALLAMGGQRRSDVALASERSVDAIYAGFETWLADRLGERIASGEPLGQDAPPMRLSSTDGRQMRALLQRVHSAKKPHGEPSKEEMDARSATFQAVRRDLGDEDPARVVAHTLVSCYVREYDSGGPRRFLQALGRKVGLLYPHFQGAVREKRIRPSVPVIDVFVRACVPSGEAIPLEEFLERLWTRFGLIVGGRRSDEWDDAEVLETAGLPVNADTLMGNTERFVDELALMGLARRYPDGVTFVGDGHGV